MAVGQSPLGQALPGSVHRTHDRGSVVAKREDRKLLNESYSFLKHLNRYQIVLLSFPHVMNIAFLLSLSNLNVLRPQSASGIKVQQYLHKKYRFLSAVLCLVTQLCPTLWTVTHRLLCPWDSPGKNTGVGCHTLSSRGSFQPRDRTQVSCIAGASLLSELPGKLKKTGVGSLSLLHSLCYWIIKKKAS